MTHSLKIWPIYYEEVLRGTKPFEVRKDDREPRFEVGDWLRLMEWVPANSDVVLGYYTSNEVRREVSYVLRDAPGIEPGYCVLGLRRENT